MEQSGGGGPQLVPSRGSTVRTEKTPAEDTPGRECPYDVFGLRPHKGTMWMSNDRVPLENIESPYGGGVSSHPGATGDLLPVMFLIAPAIGSGGVSGQWTHGGDVASGTIGAVRAGSVVGRTTG